MSSTVKPQKAETDVIGTLMSLTVAFTLAMAFRSFVLEGFVIPTGSMGPTLMGAHVRLRSPATGFEYPADSSTAIGMLVHGDQRQMPIYDPMISLRDPIGMAPPVALASQTRAGDRVLVLKPLYLVSDPKRWDVVVFKNPADPVGASQNFIKRMVGLPNETLVLLDGDVFTGPPDAAPAELRVARKPEHVQRAVWQPVHDSDWQPVVPAEALDSALRTAWDGGPWRSESGGWTLSPSRKWSHGAGSAALRWDVQDWPIDDLNTYNLLRHSFDASRRWPKGIGDPGARQEYAFATSDLRLATAIECAELREFRTTFSLRARSRIFEFTVAGQGLVSCAITDADSGQPLGSSESSFTPRTDGFMALECWHVDQQLWVFVDGRAVLQLPYEFESLDQRLLCSHVGRTVEQYQRRPAETRAPTPPQLAWSFESAAPFTLHRVRVDRDLYYRPVLHDANNQFPSNGEYLSGPGLGCDYANPARLGPTDYMMLGDNSGASRDSRMWGRAHPLTLRTFGDAQPGIVPESMIVGKAFSVYFPAPISMSPGGTAFIPDFGRVRFIR